MVLERLNVHIAREDDIMAWKGYTFGCEEIESALLSYLIEEGIYEGCSDTYFTWDIDYWPPVIKVSWGDVPRCEICGAPLSAEECETQERLEVFWKWLMSDDFYDDVEEDDEDVEGE